MEGKGLAAALLLAVSFALLVQQSGAVAKRDTAGVQLQLDDMGSLEERFAALYAQVKPGLQTLSTSADAGSVGYLQCAAAAFEKLLEQKRGSIPTADVARLTNVKTEEVQRFMLTGRGKEELLPRVHLYYERDWGLFMREIGSLDSPKASFGVCWVLSPAGNREELLVLGKLVKAEDEDFDTAASSCIVLLANQAFPDCLVIENAELGSSAHATKLVRQSDGGRLCGVVKLFLGMRATQIFQNEVVLEKAFASLPLQHSQFSTSLLSSHSDSFRDSHPECAELLIRAYLPAKGRPAVLRDFADEQKRLSNIEYARYIGRALGELHREGRSLLAKPDFVRMGARVRLQSHTVKQTVNGVIEKFYILSKGDYEFDAVGLAALLYELEECVKRHPQLKGLLTAVHGDLSPYNVFTEIEEVLFKDPAGVFEDVSFPRPIGSVTFIDYGEGGLGVGVGEVYYALLMMVMQGVPDAAVTADVISAMWSAYDEANPTTVAPIVARYYRYMTVIAMSWRATKLDVRKLLPEFSFQEKHNVVCEDHELIHEQVLASFTTQETAEALEHRFNKALDRLFSSHYIATDADSLAVVFNKGLYVHE